MGYPSDFVTTRASEPDDPTDVLGQPVTLGRFSSDRFPLGFADDLLRL